MSNIIIPDATAHSDGLTEYLGRVMSPKGKGQHSIWGNVTFASLRMFLDLGYASKLEKGPPVFLRICDHRCLIRSIPRTSSDDEKMEDVFYPFIDDGALQNRNWEFVLFFKEHDGTNFKWTMIGWITRTIAEGWKPYNYIVKHHGFFKHVGLRGDESDLFSVESFFNSMLNPRAFPYAFRGNDEVPTEKIKEPVVPADNNWGIE